MTENDIDQAEKTSMPSPLRSEEIDDVEEELVTTNLIAPNSQKISKSEMEIDEKVRKNNFLSKFQKWIDH